MKLILASNSKSRKKLLESLKIDFIVQPSNTEEYSSALLPEEYCKQISFQKALAVAKQHDEGIILAADTMVHCEGKMYGKPKTVKEAKKNIRQLSGKTHDMVTVVTIIDLYQNKTISFSAVTKVTFSKITFAMMQKYLKKEKALFARCGYGETAFFMISKIDGDVTNLYGLPMRRLEKELATLGYQLDDFRTEKRLTKKL